MRCVAEPLRGSDILSRHPDEFEGKKASLPVLPGAAVVRRVHLWPCTSCVGLMFLTFVLCIMITQNRTDIMGPLAGSSFTCFMIAALYEELAAFIDPGRWY